MSIGHVIEVIGAIVQVEFSCEDLPHVHDALTHTLQVVNYCQQLMTLPREELGIDGLHPRIVQVINILKNHKKSIFDYMKDPLNMHRSMYSLLIFACIYHDVGKGAGGGDEAVVLGWLDDADEGAEGLPQLGDGGEGPLVGARGGGQEAQARVEEIGRGMVDPASLGAGDGMRADVVGPLAG